MALKINYPEVIPTNPLLGIFQLQEKLLEHYVKIEGMPPYPLNIHLKNHQILMKEFIDRGIEELAEAHEYYRELFLRVDANSKDGLKDLVYGFNEEIADAIHFFVEALIFADIDAYWLESAYIRLFKDNSLEIVADDNPLALAIYLARVNLNEEYNPEIIAHSFNSLPITELNNDPFLIGGNRVSLKLVHIQCELLWDVTYNFNLAKNLLKNKKWTQTESLTDEESFKSKMFLSFLSLMNFLTYFGYDPNLIYTIYYHKNHINHERIKNKR